MKRLRDNKGAITIVVLITILFMISFLLSSYAIIANKVKNQKEMINETRDIYASKLSMEEIYNSYFSNDNVIPINSVEQLLAVGTGRRLSVNGKIYTFSKDSAYVLMNDLEFNASDWQSVLGQGNNWFPIGFTNIAFEGNNHKIKVTKLNNSTVEYNKENDYMNILPDEYTKADYIKSTGTQYIDTGFVPDQDTRFVIDANIKYVGDVPEAFGERYYSSENIGAIWFGKGSQYDTGNFYWTYGSQSQRQTERRDLYDTRHIFDSNKNNFYIDDNLEFTANYAEFIAEYPIYLFAMADNYTVANPPEPRLFTSCKLYSAKIYDDNIAVRYFIPCLDNNDVPCLYDLVTERAFYNQGSGNEFNYGNAIPINTVEQLLAIGTGNEIEIEGKTYTFSKNSEYILMDDLEFDANDWQSVLGQGEDWFPIGFTGTDFEGNGHTITVTKLNDLEVEYNRSNNYMNEIPNDYTKLEYLESTGTQYIDTEFIPNQDTRFVVDMNMGYTSSVPSLIGERYYSSGNIGAIFFGKGASKNDYNFYWGYDTQSSSATSRNDLYNSRHVFDSNKNYFYVDNGLEFTANYTNFTAYYPIYLFAFADSYTVENPPGARLFSSCKLYSSKIYDNDVIARYFVPCLDDNDVPCLYDLITETTFYNQATGEQFNYELLD